MGLPTAAFCRLGVLSECQPATEQQQRTSNCQIARHGARRFARRGLVAGGVGGGGGGRHVSMAATSGGSQLHCGNRCSCPVKCEKLQEENENDNRK